MIRSWSEASDSSRRTKPPACQPPSDYEGLEALGPNFRIRWIEDAGHFLHLERPEAVSAAIRAFLTGVDDTAGKAYT